MIFQQKVRDPWHPWVMLIQHVCSHCKGIQPRGKKNKGVCHYCKRR